MDRGRWARRGEPWLLGLAIGLWVGGFDILYACQDVEFDRGHGLRSIPAASACRGDRLSRAMHVATVIVMVALWRVAALPRSISRVWRLWRCSSPTSSRSSAQMICRR